MHKKLLFSLFASALIALAIHPSVSFGQRTKIIVERSKSVADWGGKLELVARDDERGEVRIPLTKAVTEVEINDKIGDFVSANIELRHKFTGAKSSTHFLTTRNAKREFRIGVVMDPSNKLHGYQIAEEYPQSKWYGEWSSDPIKSPGGGEDCTLKIAYGADFDGGFLAWVGDKRVATNSLIRLVQISNDDSTDPTRWYKIGPRDILKDGKIDTKLYREDWLYGKTEGHGIKLKMDDQKNEIVVESSGLHSGYKPVYDGVVLKKRLE